MDETTNQTDRYLNDLTRHLSGSRSSRRLLAEIHDHLDDAVAASLANGLGQVDAEHRALENIGSLETVVDAWKVRCARKDSRRRRHIAVTIAAASVTLVLAVAQHAQGRHTPNTTGSAATGRPRSASRNPQWVAVAVAKEIATFHKTFGAKAEHLWYLEYPTKVAVVVEFDRIVHLPLGGPGGRAMRLSFDRVTHQQNGELRVCEVIGDSPRLARCLSR